MAFEESKIPLVKLVIKEFDEMESKRRDEQFSNVLQSFRQNIKEGTGYALFYYNILYDDVRERLEKEGFNVRVITSSANGKTAYYITRNKGTILEKSRIGFEEGE